MATRKINTPGVTESQQPETTEETKTEQTTETVAEQVATESQPFEPSQEDLLRDELAKAKAQIEQLKNQPQPVAFDAQQPKQPAKRVPVLTKDGWTTKEAD
ncbi:hypothetical protein [Acinetobacter bereziniae]|uniref:hypothetical protein n=1 Tax=Acinetobacter bereziniae TaxID=106648 RepID=UPI0018FF3AAE|nr:hypothetical protein [Acinetobacter bereziniae]MBJ8474362.1 hypothetical protein [Acinetobacter bereziniae]